MSSSGYQFRKCKAGCHLQRRICEKQLLPSFLTPKSTYIVLVALLTACQVNLQLITRNNQPGGTSNSRFVQGTRQPAMQRYGHLRAPGHGNRRPSQPYTNIAKLDNRLTTIGSSVGGQSVRYIDSPMPKARASWQLPKISPEQAAEVIKTGAQVINRIAQADTPLNYCKTIDNQDGECSDIRKCIWMLLDTGRLKQSVCMRNYIIPAVCCPTSNSTNSSLANIIQSTLEPILLKPKAPEQKKDIQGGQLESISNGTMVGSPPPSPALLMIREPSSSSAQSANLSSTTMLSGAATPDSPTSTSTSTPSPSLSTLSAPDNSTATSVAPTPFQSQDHLAPSSTSSYSRNASLKYPWTNGTCGDSGRTRTGRIVGGSESKLGQWPWMAAMYLKRARSFSLSTVSEFWCGGALINRRFILTAAHCLSDQKGTKYKSDQVIIKLGGVDLARHQAPADIQQNAALSGDNRSTSSSGSQPFAWLNSMVQARDHDQEFSWTSFIAKALGFGSSPGSSSSTSMLAPGEPTSKALNQTSGEHKRQLAARAKKVYFKEYRVANVKQHPQFQRRGFYNDIGLIELKSDVEYDDLISPICLPSEFDLKRDLSGYMATVLGWGTLGYQGQGSKLLQQASMPIWSNKDCDARYPQDINKTFVCAGFLAGGKDACQGDSGGPLMVNDKSGRWTLHGVVSFGKMCAQPEYPGVYTRVTEFLDWIWDNTDRVNY